MHRLFTNKLECQPPDHFKRMRTGPVFKDEQLEARLPRFVYTSPRELQVAATSGALAPEQNEPTAHLLEIRNVAEDTLPVAPGIASAPHAPVPTKLHSSYLMPCAPGADGALDLLLLHSCKYVTSSLDAPCAAGVPTTPVSPRTLHTADALDPAASPSKSDTTSELSTFLLPSQSESPDEATQPSGVPSLSIYQDITHVNPDLPITVTLPLGVLFLMACS